MRITGFTKEYTLYLLYESSYIGEKDFLIILARSSAQEDTIVALEIWDFARFCHLSGVFRGVQYCVVQNSVTG